jgi:DNA-binding response OmpR family regulator
MLTSHTRVLIADGDPNLRRELYSSLLDLDIFSDCVRDGKVALDFLRDRAYAIVILDLGIPKVDALQILEAIELLPPTRRPMVLVTTALETRPTLDAELVQIVLRKPFAVDEIAAIVRSCIAGSRKQHKVRPATKVVAEDNALRP